MFFVSWNGKWKWPPSNTTKNPTKSKTFLNNYNVRRNFYILSLMYLIAQTSKNQLSLIVFTFPGKVNMSFGEEIERIPKKKEDPVA
jgi:hypothetical protein